MEQAVLELYREMNLGRNPTCQLCKDGVRKLGHRDFYGPISLWQVGRSFQEDSYRIVLVGKTARGDAHGDAEEDLAANGYINVTTVADDWIRRPFSAYWGYVAEFCRRLYDSDSVDEGWDRIAFTNLVKCNVSMTVDRTPPIMAENCMSNLRVIWKELELIRPRHVIFITGPSYDDHVSRFPLGLRVEEITQRDHRIRNGGKWMRWWERECYDGDALVCRVLRTSHPERQRKDGFVGKLVDWVRAARF